jgi:cyanophycin synthetase
MARRGDLLVIFGDNLTRSWKQIIYFNAAEGAATEAAHLAEEVPPILVPVNANEDELPGGTLIADERGVRIARETDD